MSKDIFNGRDPFDERFDRMFERTDDLFDKALKHPVRTVFLAALVNFALFCAGAAFVAWLVWLVFF